MKKLMLLFAIPLLVALGGCASVERSPIPGKDHMMDHGIGIATGEQPEYAKYHSWKRTQYPNRAAKAYLNGRAFRLVSVTTQFDRAETKIPRKRHVLPNSAYNRMLAWEIRCGLKHAHLATGKRPAVQMRVQIKLEAYGWDGNDLWTVLTLRRRDGKLLARVPFWTVSLGNLWYTNSAPWYQDHQRMIPSMAIVLVRTSKILNEHKSLNDVPYWHLGQPTPYGIGSRYGIKNPMTLKQTEQSSGLTLAQLKAIQKKNLHNAG